MEGIANSGILDGSFLDPWERGARGSRRTRIDSRNQLAWGHRIKDSKRLSEMTERAREPRAKQRPSPNHGPKVERQGHPCIPEA